MRCEVGWPFSMALCSVYRWRDSSHLLSPRWAIAPFDPPPNVWLQGLVGLGALLTTTMVLMTQTRQGQLAEQRTQLALQVRLLAEQKTAQCIAWRDALRRALPEVTNRHYAAAVAMEPATDPHARLDGLATVHEPVPTEAEHEPRAEPGSGDGRSPTGRCTLQAPWYDLCPRRGKAPSHDQAACGGLVAQGLTRCGTPRAQEEHGLSIFSHSETK